MSEETVFAKVLEPKDVQVGKGTYASALTFRVGGRGFTFCLSDDASRTVVGALSESKPKYRSKTRCSVLTEENVSLKGNEIIFNIHGQTDSFYLSRRAMCKLIGLMNEAIGETLDEILGVYD